MRDLHNHAPRIIVCCTELYYVRRVILAVVFRRENLFLKQRYYGAFAFVSSTICKWYTVDENYVNTIGLDLSVQINRISNVLSDAAIRANYYLY